MAGLRRRHRTPEICAIRPPCSGPLTPSAVPRAPRHPPPSPFAGGLAPGGKCPNRPGALLAGGGGRAAAVGGRMAAPYPHRSCRPCMGAVRPHKGAGSVVPHAGHGHGTGTLAGLLAHGTPGPCSGPADVAHVDGVRRATRRAVQKNLLPSGRRKGENYGMEGDRLYQPHPEAVKGASTRGKPLTASWG